MQSIKRISTYRVEWKGRTISVEARVEGDRVLIYSYREVEPHGYVGSAQRGGRTDHDVDPDEGSHLGEGDHATALAAWGAADRRALAGLVADAARR